MGIYDRDYIRRDRPSSGGFGRRAAVGSMRMWSVNTWLIVLCVAVFVIDGFLPTRWVMMNTRWLINNPQDIDRAALVEGDLVATGVDPAGRPVLAYRPLYLDTPQGTIEVGRDQYDAMPLLRSYLHFSTNRGFFRVEFWRFIGFQFLHANLAHLLFNMIGLYFFGPLVERHLGSKRYLAFYLLCGIFGALMYTLLNVGGMAVSMAAGDVAIPGLLFNNPNTPLIGASAGVYGVLMAGAYLVPNATVLLFFFLPMRLQTLAYALVGISLLTILTAGTNAGGEAGHLGGALAGFYFIRRPHHLHGFFDVLGYVDPTSHHYRNKRVFKRRAAGAPRDEVDRILEKISDKGLHSLTEREKRILRESAGKD